MAVLFYRDHDDVRLYQGPRGCFVSTFCLGKATRVPVLFCSWTSATSLIPSRDSKRKKTKACETFHVWRSNLFNFVRRGEKTARQLSHNTQTEHCQRFDLTIRFHSTF